MTVDIAQNISITIMAILLIIQQIRISGINDRIDKILISELAIIDLINIISDEVNELKENKRGDVKEDGI